MTNTRDDSRGAVASVTPETRKKTNIAPKANKEPARIQSSSCPCAKDSLGACLMANSVGSARRRCLGPRRHIDCRDAGSGRCPHDLHLGPLRNLLIGLNDQVMTASLLHCIPERLFELVHGHGLIVEEQ